MIDLDKISGKILDTSRGNTLINYTPSKSRNSCQLLKMNLNELITSLKTRPFLKIGSVDNHNNSNILIIKDKENELKKKLRKIFEMNRELENEQGISSIYLVAGFLQWQDRDKKMMNSPLFLVPVKLEIEKGLGNSFILKLRDEPISFNLSLYQKLREENISIIIPSVSSNFDISFSLQKLEENIKNMDFSISKECVLGIFYNNRINIFNDLNHNRENVIAHPFIQALNGNQSYIPSLSEKSDANLDFSYKRNFIVMSADSSQLKAIQETALGHSLVIEGPPGTGKSQTITNIIATALANKKKVLFVAEKKAALEVVYQNLKRVFLNEFSLYMDSNHADRKRIIDDLYNTAMKNPTEMKEELYEILNKLDDLKSYFDVYNSALHKKKSKNYSLYNIIENLITYKNAPNLEISQDLKYNISKDDLENICKFLTRFSLHMSYCKLYDYRESIFEGIKEQLLSSGEKVKLIYLIKSLKNLIMPKNFILNHLNPKTVKDILSLVQKKHFNENWIDKEFLSKVYKSILDYQVQRNKLDQYHQELAKFIDLSKLNPTLVACLYSIPNAFEKGNKKYVKNLKKNTKMIKPILIGKKKIKKENVILLTNLILSLFTLQDKLKSSLNSICSFIDVSIDDFFEVILDIEKMEKILMDFSISKEQLNYFYEINQNLQHPIIKYLENLEELRSFYDLDLLEVTFNTFSHKLNLFIGSIEEFELYYKFVLDLRKVNYPMKEFLNHCLEAKISHENFKDVFCKEYYSSMLDIKLKELDLMEFSKLNHDDVQKEYEKLDQLFNLISIAKIREIASKMRPCPNNTSVLSDIGIIKTQKEKTTLYIKELLKRVKHSLLRIKPIILMSPLAVSTYLPSDLKFDLVIFDEASQIVPEDALCSIYRAKQVIIVGDSEQLPPTDFFQRQSSEILDENEENFSKYGKSLLDISKAFLESIQLKWHYRSKTEELITFSNHYIYNDELVTFPSSHFGSLNEGIEFIPTYDAIYDKGGSRTNLIEAKKVVDLILETIDQYPKRSLGVVSFSIAQRDAIAATLDKQLEQLKKENVEKYNNILSYLTNESTTEPFFIKNLENVQGDERDVIIFSIGYGKDSKADKIFYNLGKLVQEEGRKRINVAVSRSKINMKVVCSFDPDLMKISDNNQTGLLALKNFLCYAKNKDINKYQFKSYSKDAIIEDIKNELQAKGYFIDLSIGNSKVKIDMGIKLQLHDQNYTLGILLDGDSYKAFEFTRDREILRKSMLNQQGWSLYSIYAVDYHKNRNSYIRDILNVLTSLKPSTMINNTSSIEELEYEVEPVLIFDNYIMKKYEELVLETPSKDYIDIFNYVCKEIINIEGPIHIIELSKRLLPYFQANELNDDILYLVKKKLEKSDVMNEIIIKDGFYYTKIKSNFSFRKTNCKRDILHIFHYEIIDLQYKIIKSFSGIKKETLFKEVARHCKYMESEILNLEEQSCLLLCLNKLLATSKIEVVNDLYYKK